MQFKIFPLSYNENLILPLRFEWDMPKGISKIIIELREIIYKYLCDALKLIPLLSCTIMIITPKFNIFIMSLH